MVSAQVAAITAASSPNLVTILLAALQRSLVVVTAGYYIIAITVATTAALVLPVAIVTVQVNLFLLVSHANVAIKSIISTAT